MKGKLVLLLLLLGKFGYAQKPALSVMDSAAVKALFFAGLKDKLNENYTRAGESFNKILAIDPNNAPVYYELSMLNYKQNKLSDAETAVKKATELDAENLWYWKLLAELYKRKGEMEPLVVVFNQLIRLDPDNDSYYFDRSNAYLLSGKTEEAIKGYEELERKFGPSAGLTQARQRINMEKKGGLNKEEVNKMLAEDATDVKQLLYTSGVLMDKGQHEAALAMLKKAKSAEADNFEIDLAIADVYKALNNSVEAHAALKNAFGYTEMPIDEKIKIVMLLSSGTKSQQRMSDALELARLAVKTNPGDVKAETLYGEMLFRKGDLNEALEQFKAVIKVTDQVYAAWEQTLNIQNSLGFYKDAIKTADEALSVYPNQAILYYYMASALLQESQVDRALSNIKTALQLDTDNAVYMECYGDVLFLKGDSAQAIVQWKKAKAAGNESEKLNKKINERKYIK